MCCFQSLDGWTWHPCLFYVGCVTNWTICWTVITRGCSLQRTSTFYALLTITCKLFNEGKVLVFLWQLFLWSMEFTETPNKKQKTPGYTENAEINTENTKVSIKNRMLEHVYISKLLFILIMLIENWMIYIWQIFIGLSYTCSDCVSGQLWWSSGMPI